MISQEERLYLRSLAAEQKAIAETERNEDLAIRWKKHNELEPGKPLIVIEIETFWNEVCPKLRCTDPDAKMIEERLLMPIVSHRLIGDDRVIPNFYAVPLEVESNFFGLTLEKETPADAKGIAYRYKPVITNIQRDLEKIQPSEYSHHLTEAKRQADLAEDIFGDLLPVVIENRSLLWYTGLTQIVVEMMGMENYFLAMYDFPEELHQLMRFITDDVLRFIRWQESEGILTPNWGCQYAGSSNFGFTDQLPRHSLHNVNLRDGPTDICLSDLWLNTNSQETVGISRDMFEEFALPYYKEICSQAGLVYYGCCEPVHNLFSNGLDMLPNLRKLSISPWCDEDSISQQLQNKNIVYSRKPSPNYLGTTYELNEENFRNHILNTLCAAKGLNIEFIFRDIYTLKGNPTKLNQAIKVMRNCIDRQQDY